nr:primosomal protein N' [Thioflavicoccus mobilis]
MSGAPSILRVAVPAPVPEPFDYLPPSEPGTPPPRPGQRVLVPFGRGRRVGLIVALGSTTKVAPQRLKPVIEILDERPLLAEADLAFLRWAADYYQYPLGEALFSALPGRLRRSGPDLGSGADPGERGWCLTGAGAQADLDDLKRAPRQAQVLSHLRALGGKAAVADLARVLGQCAAALRALERRGWVESCLIEDAVPAPAPVAGPILNDDQQTAFDQVSRAFGTFVPFLLEGVTASGKTEVYIRLLEAVIAAGRQALVLVPEIGLTPQLERRFAARLGGTMVILHSGLAEGERERAWRRAAAGEVDLLLGTRSAVFVPLPRLGLILIDEEHDLSFKQQEGFRYSGRDLAVRRAQQAGCPVVLGSATPSLETLANARAGRYRWLRLHRRAGGAAPPAMTLIDIRAQPLEAGLSPPLLQLAEEQLAAGNQVLLFLNRRGFAPVLTCHDCGWVGECPRCDARLTLHRASGELRCHHCGLIRPAPGRCPSCGGPDLRPLGQGTERVEEVLARRFPGLPLARVDRDSTRRKGELTRLLSAARRGDYRLLLGTQMLTKGHHFPGVTLVGVVDADAGLYGADYRAPERMAQLLVQVTGRAGRAERSGRVVVQTRHPEHPLLDSLLREGYPAFAEAALTERRVAALPPFSHQALLRAEARAADEALAFLRAAASVADVGGASGVGDVVLWGPAPAPMERRAGRWRAQLLVQSPHRQALRRFLVDWLPRVRQAEGAGRVRWSIDVDPQEMG